MIASNTNLVTRLLAVVCLSVMFFKATQAQGPEPKPGPEPIPGPEPKPGPEPIPGPEPKPGPEPIPGPEPKPGPKPKPGLGLCLIDCGKDFLEGTSKCSDEELLSMLACIVPSLVTNAGCINDCLSDISVQPLGSPAETTERASVHGP